MIDLDKVIKVQGIDFEKIAMQQLSAICYNDVKFVAVSSSGAMGYQNMVFFLELKEKQIKGYCLTPLEECPTPTLQFQHFIEKISPQHMTDEIKQWRNINMGIGNKLFVYNDVFNEFSKQRTSLKCDKIPVIYNKWAEIAYKIMQDLVGVK